MARNSKKGAKFEKGREIQKRGARFKKKREIQKEVQDSKSEIQKEARDSKKSENRKKARDSKRGARFKKRVRLAWETCALSRILNYSSALAPYWLERELPTVTADRETPPTYRDANNEQEWFKLASPSHAPPGNRWSENSNFYDLSANRWGGGTQILWPIRQQTQIRIFISSWMAYRVSFLEPMNVEERDSPSQHIAALIMITPTGACENPFHLVRRALVELKIIMHATIVAARPELTTRDISEGWMRVFHQGNKKNSGESFFWSEDDLEGPIEIRNIDFSQKFTCLYMTAPIRPMLRAYNPFLHILDSSSFK